MAVVNTRKTDMFKRKHLDNWSKSKRISGHKFREIQNVGALRVQRYYALNKALQELQLGVTMHNLKSISQKMREAFNAQDHTKVGFLIESLFAVVDINESEELTFRVADPCILIDDEPYEKMSAKHSQKKLHLFNNDEKVRAFFLDSANKCKTRFLGLPSTSSDPRSVNSIMKEQVLSQAIQKS